ncbi:MAG: phosphoesterase [Gammaproteobacteria bacterium]
MRLPVEAIIARKYFYRDNYRRVLYFLYVSLALGIVLLVGISLLLTMRTEQGFYASDGVNAPVSLNPLAAPNRSAQPLLASLEDSENLVQEEAQGDGEQDE